MTDDVKLIKLVCDACGKEGAFPVGEITGLPEEVRGIRTETCPECDSRNCDSGYVVFFNEDRKRLDPNTFEVLDD